MIFRSQRVENSFLLVHLFTDILLFFLLVRMQLQWHCTRLVLAELTVLTEAEWATWWTAEQRQPRPWCIGRRLIPWPSIQNTTIRPNITGIISEEAETWWNDTTQEKRKKKEDENIFVCFKKNTTQNTWKYLCPPNKVLSCNLFTSRRSSSPSSLGRKNSF